MLEFEAMINKNSKYNAYILMAYGGVNFKINLKC